MSELKLFDQYMHDFKDRNTKLDNQLEQFRICVADPLYGVISSKAKIGVRYDREISANEEVTRQANAVLTRDELDNQDIDLITSQKRVAEEISEKYRSLKKELYSKFDEVSSLTKTLIDNILREDRKNVTIATERSRMQNRDVRNDIYRKSVTKENSWFLSWPVHIYSKYFIVGRKKLEAQRKYYFEAKEIYPELKKEMITIVLPGSLGKDDFTKKVFFEEILPQWPTVEEMQVENEKVSSFYINRLEAILT